MNNVIIKMLDPEQYYLLEEFCEREKIPMLNPEWSKVVAAIDTEKEEIVGIVVAQMQIHCEPVWVQKEHQGKGLVKQMTTILEGYLDMLAYSSGVNIAVWNQPTNAAAERICRMAGYERSDKSLWTKIYTGDGLSKMFPGQAIDDRVNSVVGDSVFDG
jgi:hypothetical protein